MGFRETGDFVTHTPWWFWPMLIAWFCYMLGKATAEIRCESRHGRE